MSVAASDKRIVAVLCGDLPESLTPFEEIASPLDLPEKELLARIGRLRASGILRRFGATVNHRKLGFSTNAMVVWRIPEEKIEAAAEAIVSSPAVTHCYQRQTGPRWPYNLYAMIHAQTREQCDGFAVSVSRSVDCEEYRVLFSAREFKKTTPSYFN